MMFLVISWIVYIDTLISWYQYDMVILAMIKDGLLNEASPSNRTITDRMQAGSVILTVTSIKL